MSNDNTTNGSFTRLGKSDELKDHPVVPFYVESIKRRISVTRIDGTLYAFDDLCTHAGCPLSAGLLVNDSTVKCQCHGSQFDLKTGKVLKGPATEPLGSYPVRESDGVIEADLTSAPAPSTTAHS